MFYDTKVLTLKSCPFCGGAAELVKDKETDANVLYDVAYVHCTSCGCKTRSYITDGYYGVKTTVYDAINDWNNRFNDAAHILNIDPNKEKMFIHLNCLLRQDVLQELRDIFFKQFETGTVVLPPWCTCTVVPKETEIEVREKSDESNM